MPVQYALDFDKILGMIPSFKGMSEEDIAFKMTEVASRSGAYSTTIEGIDLAGLMHWFPIIDLDLGKGKTLPGLKASGASGKISIFHFKFEIWNYAQRYSHLDSNWSDHSTESYVDIDFISSDESDRALEYFGPRLKEFRIKNIKDDMLALMLS